MYGVMSSDLTLAELEEWLETDGPLNPSDIVGQERASRGRFIRILGSMHNSGNGLMAVDFIKNESLGGLKIGEDAGGYTYWIYNLDATLTTGATWRIATQTFARWDA